MDELLAALRNDNRHRAPWLAIAVGAIALAGVAVALFSSGDRPRVQTQAPAICEDAEHQLVGIWDAERQRRVRDAFAATGLSYAGASAAVVVESLNEYSDAWIAMHTQACRATHIDGTQPEDVLYLRMNCLHERRSELGALAHILGQADASIVDQSVQAVRDLTRVDGCADVDALKLGIQPPEDDATRERVAALRAEISEVELRREALELKPARAQAETLVQAARALGYAPLEAEALLALGTVQEAQHQLTAARKSLEEAIVVAEESGHERLRAEAMVARVGLEASNSWDFERTQMLARRAAAAIHRHGDDPELDMTLVGYRAIALVLQGEYQQALALQESQWPRVQRTYGQNPLRHANWLAHAAELYQWTGHWQTAVDLFEQARVLRRQNLGDEHPATVLLTESLAWTYVRRGDYDTARSLYEQTADFWMTDRGHQILELNGLHGDDHDEVRTVAGRVLTADGRPADAVEVVFASNMFGDGKYVYSRKGGVNERQSSALWTRTDHNGWFEATGVADRPDMLVAAEDDDLGRCVPVAIGAGDHERLDLRLHPFGSLHGTVSLKGERVPFVVVKLMPFVDGHLIRAAVVVNARDDGSYAFERVAAGDYIAQVSWGSVPLGFAVESARVSVVAGQQQVLDVSLGGTSGVTVEVGVKGAAGAHIESARLYLFSADTASPGDFAWSEFAPIHRQEWLRRGRVFRDGTLGLQALPPSRYVVCAIPYSRDIADGEFDQLMRSRAYTAVRHVHCRPLTVRASPERQRHIVEIPAMRMPDE